MSSHLPFAFGELKRRVSVLEDQHNKLTTICLALAKKVNELKFQNGQLSTCQEQKKERKNEVKEIKVKRKKNIPETEEDEDSSSSEEEEVVVKKAPKKAPNKAPKKASKKPITAPPKRVYTRKNNKKDVEQSDSSSGDESPANRNVAIEIVDSMKKL